MTRPITTRMTRQPRPLLRADRVDFAASKQATEQAPAGVDNTNRYHQWSGGIVGTTEATVPPTERAAANALCVEKFGEGWRVAEFHDGWGWHFQASGSVGDSPGRFWVDINDQPATCWK